MNVRSAANTVANTDARSGLARFGLTAKGILYLSLGVLAVQFASGDVSSKEVSQAGAIKLVAEQPMGKFLLVVLALGLVALTVWHVVMAATGDPVQGSEPKDKVKYAVKAVGYAGLAIVAISVTAANWGTSSPSGGGGGGGGGGEQKAADTLMGAPLGRYLVMLVGAVMIGIALYEMYKHVVQTEFMERFDVSGRTKQVVDVSGRMGYGARSIVAIIIGVFFIAAGVQSSSEKTRGLSGALKALAEQSWGPPLLWLVALGFVLFGVFCFLEARYRRAA
ncbi:MAG: DUF1206 domain-containing protein [Actinomycetota bacterium]|nr:DUF1206 domain-containing protein [Actinomycetota bacterium]